MELVMQGRNVEISSRIRAYIERKVGRLDKYMPNILEVRVDLGEEKGSRIVDRMVAQITVRSSKGTILRAEERTDDIFSSVDKVVDKIYRQIERYKGKRKRRGEELEDFANYETAVDLLEDSEAQPSLIRRKQFSSEPMAEEEAIEQMELLGHDFFVFINADNGVMNVLYRRKDGNYGLLEPEPLR